MPIFVGRISVFIVYSIGGAGAAGARDLGKVPWLEPSPQRRDPKNSHPEARSMLVGTVCTVCIWEVDRGGERGIEN